MEGGAVVYQGVYSSGTFKSPLSPLYQWGGPNTPPLFTYSTLALLNEDLLFPLAPCAVRPEPFSYHTFLAIRNFYGLFYAIGHARMR